MGRTVVVIDLLGDEAEAPASEAKGAAVVDQGLCERRNDRAEPRLQEIALEEISFGVPFNAHAALRAYLGRRR